MVAAAEIAIAKIVVFIDAYSWVPGRDFALVGALDAASTRREAIRSERRN
jgi:hypothetical protein